MIEGNQGIKEINVRNINMKIGEIEIFGKYSRSIRKIFALLK